MSEVTKDPSMIQLGFYEDSGGELGEWILPTWPIYAQHVDYCFIHLLSYFSDYEISGTLLSS
jgi:hypothetical protein